MNVDVKRRLYKLHITGGNFKLSCPQSCIVCPNLYLKWVRWNQISPDSTVLHLKCCFSMNVCFLCSLTQTPTPNIWTAWQRCTHFKRTIHLLTVMCDCIGTGVGHWRYPSVSVSHYRTTWGGVIQRQVNDERLKIMQLRHAVYLALAVNVERRDNNFKRKLGLEC